MTPLFQADSRWSSLTLGAGPSTIGRAGCVLTALTMAARELGSRPDILPPHANVACTLAGAFAGDELVTTKAAVALGMLADDTAHVGLPGDSVVLGELAKAVARGFGLARVDINLDGKGDHTILAVKRNPDGSYDCLCPAVGRMQMSADGSATVDWGHKDKATQKWVSNLKKYRIVGVRGLTKPTH